MTVALALTVVTCRVEHEGVDEQDEGSLGCGDKEHHTIICLVILNI